jgi:hypothetical protein
MVASWYGTVYNLTVLTQKVKSTELTLSLSHDGFVYGERNSTSKLRVLTAYLSMKYFSQVRPIRE